MWTGAGPGRKLISLLVAAGSLGLAGCYTSRFDRMEGNTAELREELRRLASQEAAEKTALDSLRAAFAREEEARRVARADESAHHQELMERISNLESALRDTRQSERLGPGARQTVASPAGPQVMGPPAPTPEAGADSAMSMGPGNAGEERAAYDAARLDLTRGNYDLAADGFREFLRRYSNSDLADNAQYWLGETFYGQHLYEEALSEFAKVVRDYPNGDKVPAALLKMGYADIALGRKEEAAPYLRRVVAEYPGSPEASQAGAKLRALGLEERR